MPDRKPNQRPTRTGSRSYFFLDDELHKKLFISRPSNLLVAWNYPKRKKLNLSYTDVKRFKTPAYKTTEVGYFLNRHWRHIHRLMKQQRIAHPYKAYPLNINSGYRGQYFWSEKDILEAHDFFMTQQEGPYRADGIVNPRNLPSKVEVQALMRNGVIQYIKNTDGEFIPIWKAIDWN